MRIPLDVNEARAALQARVQLSLDGLDEVLDLDIVDLDTGSAFSLLGPARDVPDALLRSAALAAVEVVGGQRLKGRRLEGTLRIGEWDHPERVDIVVHERIERWLLGMPVLRRYHLMLPLEELWTADEQVPSVAS